jgi:hypothetical protein
MTKTQRTTEEATRIRTGWSWHGEGATADEIRQEMGGRRSLDSVTRTLKQLKRLGRVDHRDGLWIA